MAEQSFPDCLCRLMAFDEVPNMLHGESSKLLATPRNTRQQAWACATWLLFVVATLSGPWMSVARLQDTVPVTCEFMGMECWLMCVVRRMIGAQVYSVLHGESSKRLATQRNTKNKKHLQSTQSGQPTNLTDQAPSTTERTAWETHNNN